MVFTTLDWIVLAACLAVPLAIGMAFYRRAGADLKQFFLSGRDLPWWVAGTSMVATTFAADTPLAVTGLVATGGIAGNWLWWNAAFGSMLTVFLFARLWRRAGVMTDVEFVEIRYGGRPAAFLRCFRALYLGLPINCLIIGWVNLAMSKILTLTMGWSRWAAVFAALAMTAAYSAASGLRGVVFSDVAQFVLAFGGTTILAWVVLANPQVGGLEGLHAALPADAFRLLPVAGGDTGAYALALPVTAFVAYIGLQWWASWYPGQEPGGGGYVAQRPRATNATPSSPRSGSPSRTTASDPGPGF
jgi:Na+/proline symporter